LKQRRPASLVARATLALGVILSAAPYTAPGDTIQIWKIGSPHRGDTPDTKLPRAFRQDAAAHGIRLQVRAFPAQGFAATFAAALKRETPPDVLVFDNFGIIRGIRTELGYFDGIGEDPVVRKDLIQVTRSFDDLLGPERGWTFLVASSSNHRAARALALKRPECPDGSSLPKVKGDLAEILPEMVTAYVAGDAHRVAQHSDPDRVAGTRPNNETARVHLVRPCGLWETPRLAFASVNASYEAETRLGHARVLLVLRKQAFGWRLLVAARDPISNDDFVKQVPSLAASLAQGGQERSGRAPATALSPADGSYPRGSDGQRFGDFTWQRSPARDVVAEIAEFAYNDDARLFLTTPEAGSPGRVSAGRLWSTSGFWTWRVWSVTRGGDIAFSETRTFLY
jgi:hypothetical protein